MAQKVIEEDVVTGRHMHEILRQQTFKLTQNLDHVANFRDFKEIHFEILNASNFEPSQNFRSEKVSHLGILPRDRDFESI